MFLYNRVSKKELRKRVAAETFKRVTLSFYRYVKIDDPQQVRDELFAFWQSLNVLGRIYIAHEGINAQLSVPEHNFKQFIDHLHQHALFAQVPLKYAIEDDNKSFFALIMKVKAKIVADGMKEGTFDTENTGKRLDALTFHNMVDDPGTVVVDMRNNYESEVGRFYNAICPDVKTFRQELPAVLDLLEDKKDKNILLYCTGGIRCEKASAWLKHNGYEKVFQLDGGIIQYVHEIKKQGLDSKFIGKNFVFDERLTERVTADVLSKCHTCGIVTERQINCMNDPCHTIFIQCETCAEDRKGCCSDKCLEEHTQKIAIAR
ncbi:MAG TPA: rhodanese-related sulfurtransferase [Bacteroidia bacterium]|nr:rhodanese-related sulfurtransferase [Bacteroidia bacterium]